MVRCSFKCTLPYFLRLCKYPIHCLDWLFEGRICCACVCNPSGGSADDDELYGFHGSLHESLRAFANRINAAHFKAVGPVQAYVQSLCYVDIELDVAPPWLSFAVLFVCNDGLSFLQV